MLGLGNVRLIPTTPSHHQAADRYDPWIEIDPSALRHNVGEVARLSGGRPILAVVKNNAYGLGLTIVGRILEPMREIAGLPW